MPIVVTGFEPLDLLEGIYMAIRQLEDRAPRVENQYARRHPRGHAAGPEPGAQGLRIGPRKWRGVGEIPMSGYRLRPSTRFDAEQKFDVGDIHTNEHPACIAGRHPDRRKGAARLLCGTRCARRRSPRRADGEFRGHVRRVLLGRAQAQCRRRVRPGAAAHPGRPSEAPR
ncbi:MAG: hypothetical protein U0838_14335 [Chloroflexota bacterium]